MAGREAVKRAVQQVRPILSVDREEARKRALNLYKAWYRQIPYIGKSVRYVIKLSRRLPQINNILFANSYGLRYSYEHRAVPIQIARGVRQASSSD